MPKYGNKKVHCEDGTFDSRAEHRRWVDLKLMFHAGEIAHLNRQVPLVLVPGVKLAGAARARPAIRLVVDFRYINQRTGETVYEDTKGMETPVSLMKRHLAKALHGIDVIISK